jgi:DNA-directed RNA polymerase subunit M/transcription elongation factor TFIIS
MKFSKWLKERSNLLEKTSVFPEPKKPEKIEKIQCPDCGENATYYYYGIGHGGNEEETIICDNPRCPSNYPKWPGMHP